MEYKIKSKPTVYKHTEYRSRLEARWAAFFDEIGWRYQYEPYDLKGWTPDFVIYGRDDRKLFVEIKPFIDDQIINEYQNRIKNIRIQNHVIILDNEFTVNCKKCYGVRAGVCINNDHWGNGEFSTTEDHLTWKNNQNGINSEYDIGSVEELFDGILWNDNEHGRRKLFIYEYDSSYSKLMMHWERAGRKTRFNYYD